MTRHRYERNLDIALSVLLLFALWAAGFIGWIGTELLAPDTAGACRISHGECDDSVGERAMFLAGALLFVVSPTISVWVGVRMRRQRNTAAVLAVLVAVVIGLDWWALRLAEQGAVPVG